VYKDFAPERFAHEHHGQSALDAYHLESEHLYQPTSSPERNRARSAPPVETDLRGDSAEFSAPSQSFELASGLQSYYRNRMGYDRIAAYDQVTDIPHSQARRFELGLLPGGRNAADQYGLRVITNNQGLSLRKGVRFEHKFNSKYHRERLSKEENRFDMKHQIYYARYLKNCKKNQRKPYPANQTYFVNSQNAAQRYFAIQKYKHIKNKKMSEYQATHEKSGVHRSVQIDQNLVAIELEKPNAALIHALHDPTSALNLTGGVPSLYSLHQAIPSDLETFGEKSSAKNVHELLQNLHEDSGPLRALQQMADDHPLKATAKTLRSIVSGLNRFSLVNEDLTMHPVVRSSVNALGKALRALPTLTEDAPRFFSCYEKIIEETNLVLMTLRPYRQGDYKTAALRSLTKRLGRRGNSLDGLAIPETYLVSNGMDALGEGIKMAQRLSGQKHVGYLSKTIGEDKPDYYELNEVLHALSEESEMPGRAVLSIVNPSSGYIPNNESEPPHWNARVLASEIQRHFAEHQQAPLVAVIDTTIETFDKHGVSDLQTLYTSFEPEIASGQLKLLLCKSYQKFQSLGSGKIMAGAISIVARDDQATQLTKSALRDVENSLNWMSTQDAQLLTHFLKHAEEGEAALIHQADENARFLHEMCFKKDPRVGYEPGVPLLMIENVVEKVRGSSAFNEKTLHQHLAQDVPDIFSFGFLQSSVIRISDNARISVGQESRSELIEKLYATKWLLQTPLSMAAVENKISAVLTDGFHHVTNNVDVRKWADTAIGLLQQGRKYVEGGDAQLHSLETLLAASLDTSHIRSSTDAGESLRTQLLAQFETIMDVSKETLITDFWKIIGSAFAPAVPSSVLHGNDVQAMRSALQHDPVGFNDPMEYVEEEYVQARYAPNMAASLYGVLHNASNIDGMNSEDLQTMKHLYTSMLESGLPGVSPAYRAKLVPSALKWLIANETQNNWAQSVARYGHLLPYQEEKAALLIQLSAYTFPEPIKKRLADVLYRPLSASLQHEVRRRSDWR
jgi:hypothetical protein